MTARPAPRRSVLGRIVRVYALALLGALLVGLAIGFVIRARLERPRVHMGRATQGTPARAWLGPMTPPALAAEQLPLRLVASRAPVLDAAEHEE